MTMRDGDFTMGNYSSQAYTLANNCMGIKVDETSI